MRFAINIHGTGEHILLDVRNDTFTEFHGGLSPIDDARRAAAQAFNVSKGVLTSGYFASPFANYKQLTLDFLDAIPNSRAPVHSSL
jgi:hypothetical protein